MTNLLGRRLGRYEIRAEIGRGGMARVYRAVDTLLQRPVAIKVLAVQLSMDPEFIQRFAREARTAAGLRHPGIVTIYDVGEQDGLYFIAMEYIDGRTLHSILEEQSALGIGYAVSLLDPVARALDFAHTQGAVHRDVKPHNVMLDVTGRVLLTDFGIAQTPEADGERLTRTGVFMGTPEYISPEQAEAGRVDGRSDLYSLGVMAYEIITGRVPFTGAAPQLIVSHAQLPPPPPTSVRAHLPSEIDAVLARALAKRPESRYPSGTDMVEALRGVAQRYGEPLVDREQLAALVGIPHAAPDESRPPRPPAIPPSAPRPPTQRPQPRPQSTNTIPPTANRPQAKPATGRGKAQRGSASPLALLLIGAVLVFLTLLLLFTVARGLTRSGTATPVPTLALTPSLEIRTDLTPSLGPSPNPTPISPTIIPSPLPLRPTDIPPLPDTPAPLPDTPTLTNTPAQTSTPTLTNTSASLTNTPAPLTSTPAPLTSTPASHTSTPAPLTSTPAPLTSTP
ncbi:MAG: protein kinase, partial [Chloroflexales bacterium]